MYNLYKEYLEYFDWLDNQILLGLIIEGFKNYKIEDNVNILDWYSNKEFEKANKKYENLINEIKEMIDETKESIIKYSQLKFHEE